MSEYDTYDDDFDDDVAEDSVDDAPQLPNRAQRRTAKKAQRRAARRELDDGTELVAVDHDGETYWVPADPTDWPIDVLAAFEDGKAVTALRGLLADDERGESGWKTLQAKKYRVRDLNEIFEKVAKVGGFSTSGN